MVSSTDQPGSQLCQACGICCDGTLFDSVPVAGDEGERLDRHGIAIVGKDTPEALFHQPCQAFSGSACLAYGDRPQSCRSYQCMTLKAVIANRIGVVEAQQRISGIKALLAELTPLMRKGESLFALRKRMSQTAENGADMRINAEALMQLGLVEITLDRHFRHPERRYLKGKESDGETMPRG